MIQPRQAVKDAGNAAKASHRFEMENVFSFLIGSRNPKIAALDLAPIWF